MQCIEFLVPGDITTCTGGYTYDRQIAAQLASLGINTRIHSLNENLTASDAHAEAVVTIEQLPDNSVVIVDGLALAPLAETLAANSFRLHLYALLHHPAALETGLRPQAARLIARQELAALQAMHRVICTSAWTAQTLAESGISHERIAVVEPGVDKLFADIGTQHLRRGPRLAHSQGLNLLCVATLIPRKGHDILINALSELQHHPWQLDCIGSHSRDIVCAQRISSLISELGLRNRIHLHDEISRPRLADAYARADLFVLASALEGYGMVFAEARAAGLPIVATSGGATAQTVKDSGAIVTDDRTQHGLSAVLGRLLQNADDWLELSRAAKTGMNNVRGWDQAATEFARILQSAPGDE